MKVEINTEVTHSVLVPLFGKYFTFNTVKRVKEKDVKKNLDLFANKILSYVSEVRWEWGRNDEKKVILFYNKSSNGISFSFAVEADENLTNLMKESQDNVAAVCLYVANNYKILNFQV